MIIQFLKNGKKSVLTVLSLNEEMLPSSGSLQHTRDKPEEQLFHDCGVLVLTVSVVDFIYLLLLVSTGGVMFQKNTNTCVYIITLLFCICLVLSF